jgi:hypothetical protein
VPVRLEIPVITALVSLIGCSHQKLDGFQQAKPILSILRKNFVASGNWYIACSSELSEKTMSSISGSSTTVSSYLKDLQQDLEAELKNARQKSAEEQDRSDQRLSELKQKYESENQRSVEDLRRNHEESSVRERNQHREEVKRLQQDGYDRRGKSLAESEREFTRMSESVKQAQAEARARATKAEAIAEKRAEQSGRAAQERSVEDTRTYRDAQASQQAELRESVKRSLDLEKYYKQDRADGRRQAYAEIEGEFRKDREILERQLRTEIEGLREKSSRKLDNDSLRQSEITHERDVRHANQIRSREAEHHSAQQDISRRFDTFADQVEHRESGTVKSLERELELQRKDLAAAFERTHQEQARNYQERLSTQQDRSQEEIQDLTEQLLESKGMPDPRKVSPAAYERIRESAIRQSEESIAQREARYKANLDTTRTRAEEVFSDQARTHARDISRINREKTASELHAQAKINLVASESEERVASTRIDKERELVRALSSNDKIRSREMEVLRRKYEEILEGVKNDAADKVLLAREQADFENRMTRRAFSAQQNELIRDYEKRLDDTRAESVEQVKKAQEEAQKTIRELEGKQRDEMERNATISQRRIAQLEQQYQNRERIIARNYQEEIEKLKRSNAQLQSKKS